HRRNTNGVATRRRDQLQELFGLHGLDRLGRAFSIGHALRIGRALSIDWAPRFARALRGGLGPRGARALRGGRAPCGRRARRGRRALRVAALHIVSRPTSTAVGPRRSRLSLKYLPISGTSSGPSSRAWGTPNVSSNGSHQRTIEWRESRGSLSRSRWSR